MTILTVSNLAKSYRSYSSELKRVASWFGLPVKPAEEHWVLHDISFSISEGEAIGVLGQNGAGKSTLLKMITGTLPPTKGTIQINGRIAAILELGMGFNPEFTGRQNAFHGLSMMGYTQPQIEQAMPELEAFAEIGEYFDQALRIYSSGMQARLAFAVATCFRPDILIVDEALSVGDAYFQSKCFKKMNELKLSGVSILLVSHDIQAIRSFCDFGLLIHNGIVLASGEAKTVSQFYEKKYSGYLSNENDIKSEVIKQESKQVVECSSKKAEFLGAQILVNKEIVEVVETGTNFNLVFNYRIFEDLDDPHYGFRIADRFGNSVFESNTYCLSKPTSKIERNSKVSVTVEFSNFLAPGEYTVDVALVNGGYDRKYFNDSILMNHNVDTLKIILRDESYIFAGYCDLKPKIRLEVD